MKASLNKQETIQQWDSETWRCVKADVVFDRWNSKMTGSNSPQGKRQLHHLCCPLLTCDGTHRGNAADVTAGLGPQRQRGTL